MDTPEHSDDRAWAAPGAQPAWTPQPGDPQPYPAPTGKAEGQFCIVRMSARNTGTSPERFNAFGQRAATAAGVEYAAADMAGYQLSVSEKTPIWVTEVNPGVTRTGALVFDVPAGTQLAVLRLRDDAVLLGNPAPVDFALS